MAARTTVRDLVDGFNRWPALVRGLALAICVVVAGIGPPTILDEVGLRLTPGVPWVAPVALGWMWMVWRMLARPGWWREHLRVGELSKRQGILALSVLAAGTWVIHAARMAGSKWLGVDDGLTADLSPYSTSVLLSSFFVTALAAGLFEEAAYRGFLQRVLEERYGVRMAIPIAALIFAGAHWSRGPGFLMLTPPVFGFGCLYGYVAWKAGSIWPGIAVHTGYNLARLVEQWMRLGMP